MEDASGRKLYVCLRCGNKFWSRAKKPQCPVCRSKRVMLYEDFLKLPQEEQDKILGKKKPESGDISEAVEVKEGENGEKEVNSEVEEREPEVKREDKLVKRGGSPEIPENPPVKKGDEKGERVKGEKVKRLKLPKLGWKAYAVLAGLAFVYYLYKVGWFDEMFRQLKRLGALEDMKEPEEEKPVVRSSPVLGKIEKNLGRG